MLGMGGCARSPTVNILGSFFPAWLISIVTGLVLMLIAWRVLMATGVAPYLAPAGLVYPCLAALRRVDGRACARRARSGPCAPEWHFTTIRDRLVGIMLGNVVITLVFLYVWPVDALTALRRNLAAALRTTAHLATVEGESDDPAAMARSTAALRAQSDRNFSAVHQSLEEAGFEAVVPGEGEHATRAALQRVTSEAQAVFLNQLAVARHRPDFAPGVLPPPVRAGIRRLNSAVAARLDAVADRIEGKAETPLPDLQAPLADLGGVVESFLGHPTTADVAAEARGRLDLYRVLVPRIEALSVASSAERFHPGAGR